MNKSLIRNIFRELLIFIVGVSILLVFWRDNLLVTGSIFIIYFVRYYFWNIKGDTILFITGAILGSSTEIIATHVGVWQYTNPDLLNIPLWLPFAWGFVTVLIIRIAENIMKMKS